MNVVTFYRFVALDEPESTAERLRKRTTEFGLCGTIVLAREGINATLAGTERDLRCFVEELERDARFANLAVRHSRADPDNPIFYRMKVRVRRELIALHRDVDPTARTGERVDAAMWNRLLDDPTFSVIDTRNRYEIALGTFPGAVDPHTRSFKEFATFAESLDPRRHSRIAMCCTGGIRCEKASALLLERGVTEVYQLDGGILAYLSTAGAYNRFVGECYVFDQRVSVSDRLEQGAYTLCHGCRTPLGPDDVASDDYVVDVSCPHCVSAQTPRQRSAFAERARQARLAQARGARHVGASMASRR